MKEAILIALFLVPSIVLKGQEDSILKIPDNALSWHNPIVNTDSLKELLRHTGGYEKVDALCELAYALQLIDRQKKNISVYLDEALKISEELDYCNGKVKALFIWGDYYRRIAHDSEKSIAALRGAESFLGSQINWTLWFRVWAATGQYYRQAGEQENAVLYYQNALHHFDKDTAWYAHIKLNLYLMQLASLRNDHAEKWHYMESIHDLFIKHHHYLSYKGFGLLGNVEELSINLANYGEYKRASEIMFWVLHELEKQGRQNLYTEFFTAKILGRIGRIYSHWGKPDSALVFFNKSIHHFDHVLANYQNDLDNPSISPSYRLWLINAVNQLEERADVLIRNGSLNQAKQDLLKSIEVRKEKDDPLGVAMCYDKLGELYALRGEFLEALQWYDISLEIKKEVVERELSKAGTVTTRVLFSRESIASTYLKKGKLFRDRGRMQPAFEYFNTSLASSRESGFQRGEAEALLALGNLHLTLQQHETALEFFNTAKTIYENMGHRTGSADVSEKMGDFYYQQDRISEAKTSYRQSQDIFDEQDMPSRTAALLIRQGNLLTAELAYQDATVKYAEALLIGEKINLPRLKMEAFKGLADAYAFMGFYKEAFANYKNYREIKDELFNLEVERHIVEIEAEFETEQNRQQLLLLKREKELMEEKGARSELIIMGMILFIVTLLLIIFMYFRQNRLSNGHERIQLQQKLFRSQMNPHFIFNTLGSIQSSIINEEPRKAVKYLSRFSKLMRSILDSSIHENIPLSKELSTIENYLELQKARFPHKFDFVISGTENLDAESICTPPMLAQPFIENAIEHGIKHRETKGIVSVNYQLTGNILTIKIEDNGIGRKKAGEFLRKHDKDHISMATDITLKRIEVHNRKSKHPIRFKIEDLCDDKGESAGTRVVFAVPV